MTSVSNIGRGKALGVEMTGKEDVASGVRKTVVERAVMAISKSILDGRFAPGQRLIEAELTRELGISRNPLREAFGRLAADGWVQIEPYRGAVVTRPTRRELQDLFTVRCELEGCATRFAAQRISMPAVRTIAIKEIEPLLAVRDEPTTASIFHIENRQFHGLILELAGNSYLPRLLDQLQIPVFEATFFRLYDRKLYEASMADHRAIFAAVMAGDAAKAEEAAREHVKRTAILVQSLPDHMFKPE